MVAPAAERGIIYNPDPRSSEVPLLPLDQKPFSNFLAAMRIRAGRTAFPEDDPTAHFVLMVTDAISKITRKQDPSRLLLSDIYPPGRDRDYDFTDDRVAALTAKIVLQNHPEDLTAQLIADYGTDVSVTMSAAMVLQIFHDQQPAAVLPSTS